MAKPSSPRKSLAQMEKDTLLRGRAKPRAAAAAKATGTLPLGARQRRAWTEAAFALLLGGAVYLLVQDHPARLGLEPYYQGGGREHTPLQHPAPKGMSAPQEQGEGRLRPKGRFQPPGLDDSGEGGGDQDGGQAAARRSQPQGEGVPVLEPKTPLPIPRPHGSSPPAACSSCWG